MSPVFIKSRIIILFCIGMIIMGIFNGKDAKADEYQKLKTQAEKEYSEGSYSRAHNLYEKIRGLKISEKEREWVRFRLSDTLWRGVSSTDIPDSTKIEQARKELEDILREKSAEENRDYIWAKAEESMGDFYWIQRNYQNWSAAWQYYEKALDWWSGAKDIEEARRQYLAIIWRCARPGWADSYYYYGYYGNYLPLNIAENVLKISKTPDEKAYAHYLIAMTLQYQGQWELIDRVPEEFEAALKVGKKAVWYGDALFYYAEWSANNGRRHRLPNGQWQQKPDYHKALELYNRIIKEFKKGETRYYEEAKQRIKYITEANISINVANIFLPGSEIEAYLSWRNQKKIDFKIYKIDLTRDISFNKNFGTGNWIHSVKASGKKAVKSWSKSIESMDYMPGSETIRLEEKLPAGAYILEARGDKSSHRDLILVTDITLVMKTAKKQTLVYVCDARDGSPVPKASVKILRRYYASNSYETVESEKETDADGLALFETKSEAYNSEIFAAVKAGDRQVYGQTYSQDYSDVENWRIYAFTDRAAYRPEETVSWKMIARLYKAGNYSTPADKVIEYDIQDARGVKIKSEKRKLNSFGSVWGSIELTKEMALGEYYINIYSENRKLSIGRAALFRLEEYKLPEFKISIKTPEENAKRKSFRLGDSIEASIKAEYYFGGPVADASVEVVIYQNPYYHWWRPYTEYSWYYNDMYRPPNYWGRGQVVRRETIKTDGRGIARVSFASPRGGGQDLEYRIEARVVDSSRREIIGSETIRVTRHSYDVSMYPEHIIYKPQDNITIKIKAQDANNNPVSASGKIKVTRDRWIEIWINPAGKKVLASEWRSAHPHGPAYPWSGNKPEQGWRIKFQGYEHEDVLTSTVKTGANGEAEFNFTAAREGYYRIKWESEERKRSSELIKAETTIWAATNATTDTGYRHGGMGILIDKDTVRAGAKAPVMITTPVSSKFVLFSVEADDLYFHKLIRMEGTAKFFEITIEKKYVPNVFLNACMVSDVQIFTDIKQVIVPPVEHFLNVEVTQDKGEYQPREEGKLTLNVRDHEGKPVAAEIALSMTDEAVSYIQSDYAGDPRQFYYGSKRSQRVVTHSTFHLKSYKLVTQKIRQSVHEGQIGGDDTAPESDSLADEISASSAGYAGAKDLVKKSRMVKEERALPASAPKTMSKQGSPSESAEAVQVRHDFRATAFWQPDIQSGLDGKAYVTIKYPDSLTSWKAVARVSTNGNQFGIASSTTTTKMPLIVRLQAPKFFITGDSVTVSAVINNNTNNDLSVKTILKAQGIIIKKPSAETVKIKAGGEARVDWEVDIKEHGDAKLAVEARGESYADAMEKTYPVYEHGLTKFIAKSGKVKGAESIVKIDIPKERKPETTTLAIQATPSLAVTLLDSLPYLFDYPYGCTEQTLSRFVPAVIVAKTLTDLKIRPEAIAGKMFGGIEKAYADKTQLKGRKDFKKLDEMIKQGLNRLYDFQHKDGGWGWWKEGAGDHYMTAYVVWGLTLAAEAGLNVKKDVISRGASFLDKSLVEKDNQPDIQAWMLHALGRFHENNRKSKITAFQEKAFKNSFEQRDRLNAYTRSLLAMAAHDFGYREKALILIRNLENGVIIDDKPDRTILHKSGSDDSSIMGTAHWGNDGMYWRWSDGGIESTSFALKAMLAVDPGNKLVEPAMNWLIKNRRGAQWSNTRDTAIGVLALNDYLRVSGELVQDQEYEIFVNGNFITKQMIKAADALNAPSVFKVKREYIKSGENEIKILNKIGKGAIYFSAHGEYYSLEKPIKAVGNEIYAKRQYYKYVGRPSLLKGYVYDKMPLNDNETVESGQRVETVITVETKNDYEYLVIEDLKPAGLEAVELKSGQPLYAREIKSGAVAGFSDGKQKKKSRVAPLPGYMNTTGRTVWIYQELRDRKIVLFIDKLPQGIWEIRYTLRAEVPGKFHGLPVTSHAMYVPEIRCNSDEVRITVRDAKK